MLGWCFQTILNQWLCLYVSDIDFPEKVWVIMCCNVITVFDNSTMHGCLPGCSLILSTTGLVAVAMKQFSITPWLFSPWHCDCYWHVVVFTMTLCLCSKSDPVTLCSVILWFCSKHAKWTFSSSPITMGPSILEERLKSRDYVDPYVFLPNQAHRQHNSACTVSFPELPSCLNICMVISQFSNEILGEYLPIIN